MNLVEGGGRLTEVLTRHFTEGTEKNNEKQHSE
jgi:hypothetical protein